MLRIGDELPSSAFISPKAPQCPSDVHVSRTVYAERRHAATSGRGRRVGSGSVERSPIEAFDQVAWYADRAVLGDQVFRLQHVKNDDTWDLGDDHFVFFKLQDLVNQYRAFFARRPAFRPRNVLELGIWDGGSTVFWFEIFRPDKHVAIDIDRRGDSEQFTRYVRERNLADRLGTRWSIDQSDREALTALVRQEFVGPLDLVVDDASHFLEPTRASFNALFPPPLRGGNLRDRGLGVGPLARVPPAQPDVGGRAPDAIRIGSRTGSRDIGGRRPERRPLQRLRCCGARLGGGGCRRFRARELHLLTPVEVEVRRHRSPRETDVALVTRSIVVRERR